MKKVSVIIPSYNYGSYIAAAIDSALSQDFSPLEIIVIDDGSTDCTKTMIDRNYKDKVNYFYQQNRGAPAARNRGIAESRGEYIIFLDADDALGRDQVSSLVHCSKRNPNCLVYGPSIRYIEENGTYKELYVLEDFDGPDMLDGWLRGWYIAPCCILWSRKVLDNLGGWDECLLANQDGDLVMRALIQEYIFRFCPFSHAFVRAHTSDIVSISSNHSYASLCSRLSVLKKVERLLRGKRMIEDHYTALSEAYYNLGRFHARDSPSFAKACFRNFRRLRGFGRPPGTNLNWFLVTVLGLVNKERFARWWESSVRHRLSALFP